MTTSTSNSSGLYPAANSWFQSDIPDYYSGNTVAGFTPYQTQGFDSLNSASQNVSDSGSNLMNIYMSRLNSGEGQNPYLQQVVDNYGAQMNRNFSERTLPALRGRQIAAGGAGSSASGIAQGLATQDLNRTISDTTSQMYMDDWTNAMNNMSGMQTMYQNSQMLPGQTQLQIGSMQQSQNQANIDGEVNRWNYYRDAPENRLRAYSNLLSGGNNYTQQTSTSTSGTPSFNWGNAAMSGLMYSSPYWSQGQDQSDQQTSTQSTT